MNELKSNKRLNKNKIKLKHNGGKIKKRNSKKKKNKSKRKYYRTKKGGSYASRPQRTHADVLSARLREKQQNYTPPAGKKNTLTKYSKRSKPPSHTGKTPAMGEWMQYHQARHKSRLGQVRQETQILKQMQADKMYNLGRSDVAYNHKIDVHGLKREKTVVQWTGIINYLKSIPNNVMDVMRTPDNYDFSEVKFLDMHLNPDPIRKNTLIVTIGILNKTTKEYDRFNHEIPEDTKLILWEGTPLAKPD